MESSSSVASSSSVEESSSSIVASSSSIVPSSSSEKSSSSSAKSSSSEKSSSSSAKSSSSSAKSSSSKAKSSSSEKGDAIVAAVLPSFGLGYVNNELTVTLPKASMVRVQVFDLMGHRVESFSESVSATRSFSLAHLNKGSYVVRVESGRMARSAKIVVK